jgi:hypothetical protein
MAYGAFAWDDAWAGSALVGERVLTWRHILY